LKAACAAAGTDASYFGTIMSPVGTLTPSTGLMVPLIV